MSCEVWCLPATLQHTRRIRPGRDQDMKTNAISVLLLCLGLQVSVALRAQTSQSVMAAGDAGRAVSTESGGGEGASGLRSPVMSGERHPLYRLGASDGMEISFTFAPEF